MDPSKAMQFQTFPHPGNGHSGTMGPPVGHPTNASAHSRSGSQSMVPYISFTCLNNVFARQCDVKLYIKRFPRILVKTDYFTSYIQQLSITIAGIAVDFFRSPVKTAATLEYHPKEAAAVRTMSSHPSTMIRLIALPRKTSTDHNTDNTAHLMIITDLADQSDVAVQARLATFPSLVHRNRLHRHRGTTRIRITPASTTARRAMRSARPSVIATSLSTATTAVSRKIRDSSENEHGGDHELKLDTIRRERSQDSLFPFGFCRSCDMLPLDEQSRSDSARLLMLVSYALRHYQAYGGSLCGHIAWRASRE